MAPRVLLVIALAACAAPALAHSLHAPAAPHYVYADVENACDEPMEVIIAGVAKSLEPGALARFELCVGTCPGHEDTCGHYAYTYTYRTASPDGKSWDVAATAPACALDRDVVSPITLTCGSRRALLQDDKDYSDEDYGDENKEDYGEDETSYGDDESDSSYGDSSPEPSESDYRVYVDVVNDCSEEMHAEIGGPDDSLDSAIESGKTERFAICTGYCTGYEGRCESIEYDYNAYVTADNADYKIDGTFTVDSCALTDDYVTTITLTCDDLDTGSNDSGDTGGSSPSSSKSPSPSLGTGTPSINPNAGSSPAGSGSSPRSSSPSNSGGSSGSSSGSGSGSGSGTAKDKTTGGSSGGSTATSSSAIVFHAWDTMVLAICGALALI